MEMVVIYNEEKLFRAAWKNQIRKDGTVSYLAFKDKKGKGTSVQRQYDRSRNIIRSVKDCVSFMEKCGFSENILSITIENVINQNVICKETPTNDNPYHCELYASNGFDPLDDIDCANLALLCFVEKRV